MSAGSIERRDERRVGALLGGKYRIERVLGAGGMATVFAAVHRNGARFAIKVLHEDLAHRGDTRARFLREGYVANMIGHPGAVRILDDDVAEDGSAYLVMELLAGETLRARLGRSGGKLPCREVLALGHQLADVLSEADAAGIVHRDVKPENLFLTTDRALKVLDFGIARVEDDPAGLATVTGTRLGTPAFMPPELALGRTSEIDGRTDVWSAGATLFQLLSGEVVHPAPTAAEMVVRAATVPARSLATACPDAPAGVVALVDRALAFAREDRFPSARELRQAIAEAHLALYGEPVSAASIGPVEETVKVDRQTVSESPPLDPLDSLDADEPPPPERAHAGPDDVTVQDPLTMQGDLSSDGTLASPPLAATPPLRSGPPTPMSVQIVAPDERPDPAGAPAVPPSPLRRRAGLFAGLALAAALMGYLGSSRTAAPVPPAPVASAPAAEKAGCTTNRQCVEASGGAAAICRPSDGACVPLASEDCRVLAEPSNLRDDATVWIGAMWPVGEPDPLHYGPRSANAADLARRDFAETTGGLPPARPGGPRRPIGIVLCDDRANPERAADHLIDDVRVPAILGFRSSKEVLDLATSRFLQKGVLAIVATGSATTLRNIPVPPNGPRLTWRVTPSTDQATLPFAAVVEHVLEPELRSTPGILKPGEPIRIAQLRQESLAGQSTVDSRMTALRWNGKSVAENGDAFRQIARAEAFVASDPTQVEANERTAREIAAFAPHILLDMPPNPALLTAIERRWPASARFRPRYLTEGKWIDLGGPAFDWRANDLYRRVHSLDFPSDRPSMVRFALRYNEHFTPRVTPANAPTTPYDAFYLFAYAAATLGDEPLTGAALSRAIARLQPPGEPIDVGPGQIYPALLALGAGKNIDLQGVGTSLDLDPQTGDSGADFALFCLAPQTARDPARQIDSGLLWASRTRSLAGARRCP